jgi:hypothetical protein
VDEQHESDLNHEGNAARAGLEHSHGDLSNPS